MPWPGDGRAHVYLRDDDWWHFQLDSYLDLVRCAPTCLLSSIILGPCILTCSMSSQKFHGAIIHEVSELAPWPHNLLDVTRHLECSLATIPNDISSKLSPLSKRIYETEVMHSSHLNAFRECQQLSSLAPITDVLDTLLSTVQYLRDFTQKNTGNLPARSTFPILIPLLAALAIGCSPDADLLYVCNVCPLLWITD